MKVYPKQRVRKIKEYLSIEFLVFLLSTLLGLFKPERVCIIEGLDFLILFIIGGFKVNFRWKEGTILFNYLLKLVPA
jgi:hypothetical protein